jgi:hypothetical protein
MSGVTTRPAFLRSFWYLQVVGGGGGRWGATRSE